MWFPTPEQVAFAAQAAREIYGAVGKDLVTELIDAVRHGKPTFLLFGPGGDGKSTLAKFLETLSENKLDPNYSMSPVWERGKIKGRRLSSIAAFPGQSTYLDVQIRDHRNWLQGIRRPFVVLCFSYGYRAVDPRQSSSRRAPQANTSARQEELKYADIILNNIHTLCNFPRYTILSMILKQDLWWDEKDDVALFYEVEYEKVLDRFSNRVGRDNFTNFVFPLCLIRSNLHDVNGVVIKQGSGAYDEVKRREHMVYFLNTLGNILRGT